MKRHFASAAGIWIAGSLLVAVCSPFSGIAAEKENGAEPAKARKVAVLTYSFSSEYWGYVAQGCMAYGNSDPAIEITVESVSSSIASDEQLAMLKEDLDYGRYDGYVIAAINRERTEQVLENVNVPVVVMDAPVSAPCVIGRIGTNNQTAALAGAKKAVSMAKALGRARPDCVMIGGVDGDFNQESRREGYRGGVMISGGIWLSEVYPTDKSADGAREAMEQIMEKHPDGVGIVACYNDLLAVTAIEMAKGNDAFSDTVFIGFDGNGSVCERIMEDEHYENLVTVAQNPYEMGFGAVKMLSDYWKNGEDGIPEDGTVKSDETNRMPADSGNMTAEESSAMTDQAGQGAAAAEEENYIDSGYSVITKVNVQERMGQIRNHLS